MNRTETIKNKLEALEKEIASAAQKRTELETALAEAYSNAGETEAAHKALSDHRDRLADMIGAVSALDVKLRDTSMQEASEVSKKIAEESEKRRRSVENDIKKAAAPLQKAVSEFLTDTEGERFLQDTTDDAMARFDLILNRWTDEQRAERMPENFSGKAPYRDTDGRCFFETDSGYGHYRQYRFFENKGGKLLTGGPHRLSVDLDKEQAELDREAASA